MIKKEAGLISSFENDILVVVIDDYRFVKGQSPRSPKPTLQSRSLPGRGKFPSHDLLEGGSSYPPFQGFRHRGKWMKSHPSPSPAPCTGGQEIHDIRLHDNSSYFYLSWISLSIKHLNQHLIRIKLIGARKLNEGTREPRNKDESWAVFAHWNRATAGINIPKHNARDRRSHHPISIHSNHIKWLNKLRGYTQPSTNNPSSHQVPNETRRSGTTLRSVRQSCFLFGRFYESSSS